MCVNIGLCWKMPLPMNHSVFCFICLWEEPFSLYRSLVGEPKAWQSQLSPHPREYLPLEGNAPKEKKTAPCSSVMLQSKTHQKTSYVL